MKERIYPKVQVSEKAERSLRSGHPWVFGTEVQAQDANVADGQLADVVSSKGRYLGTGFVNRRSKIAVRVISQNANDRFDEAFWRRRVRHALEYRRTVMGEDLTCCRLLFGEADLFPGFTVDRFGQVLVCQTLSLGIEGIKPLLFRLLFEELKEMGVPITSIYERNDVGIRALEGMEEYKGFFEMEGLETCPTHILLTENGIQYEVDIENGQKTGFFLDQKYNRRAVASLCRGKKVLDCFTHTGAFALNAAAGGAEYVHAVDISADAVELARANAERNGLASRMSFEKANVFDLLTRMSEENSADYDLIILDPPAFTKSHGTVRNAVRGYKEINLKAMKLLPRGGYLATCSCSHFMTEELFCKMLRDAARDAGVSLRQIEARQQSPDHPILWGVPETNYLKFYLFQVF